MASNRYKLKKFWSAETLCQHLDSAIIRGDRTREIVFVASAKHSCEGGLIFISSDKFIDEITERRGLICICNEKLYKRLDKVIEDSTIIICDNPKATFQTALSLMFPEENIVTGINSTAQIDTSAKIDLGVSIGAFAVIGPNCIIGRGCKIGAFAVLSADVHLGQECHIDEHVCISYTDIDDNVRIGSHSVIGKRGFGFNGQGDKVQFLHHLGRVIIGKGCDIGAAVTIDRGTLDNTVIGDFVMIDNQCHIAHNADIGDNVIMAGQVGISGSVEIGKNCILAGKTGIADNIKVTDNCIFIARSTVIRDINVSGIYAGNPAVPVND